jgi:anti-sigma factor RsiW
VTGFSGIFEDHLGIDAVVAYVDGELSLTAYQRAAAHLERCPLCAAEVADQSFARESLRGASAPPMPMSLLANLQSIPIGLPASASAQGIGVDPRTGSAIRVHHITRDVTRSRRFRFGAGALVAGIAVGALVSSMPTDPSPASTPSSPTPPSVNRPIGATPASNPLNR